MTTTSPSTAPTTRVMARASDVGAVAEGAAEDAEKVHTQPSRALVRTSDARAMRMRRDMLDCTDASFVPAAGSAVERLAALERELRMILGDDVVEDALRLEDVIVDVSRSGGDSGDLRDDGDHDDVAVFEPSSLPALSSPVVVEDVAPTTRDSASTSDADIEEPRRTLDVEPSSSITRNDEVLAPEPTAVAEWDPYSAFMKRGTSKTPTRKEDKVEELVSSAVFTPPKVAKMALMVSPDPSLTHDETLRLVAELEDRMKSAPFAATSAPPARETPELPRATSAVFVEDITGKDDGGSDDEQRYVHQYTQRDAEAILEQIESDAVTGIWRDAPEPAPAPAILAPRSRHGKEVDDEYVSVPSISGVESLSDFKLMMSSVFDDDDEDNF